MMLVSLNFYSFEKIFENAKDHQTFIENFSAAHADKNEHVIEQTDLTVLCRE
jgi:hypothetical protein